MAKGIPLFQCQECGHKFYSTKSAERASFGDNGCPGCGGSDIDTYVPSRDKKKDEYNPHARELML